MGRSAGFDFYENTLLVPHTTGTAVKPRLTRSTAQSPRTVVLGCCRYRRYHVQAGRRFHGCRLLPVHHETGFYRRTATVRGHCGLRWRRWYAELCPRPSTPRAVARTSLPLAWLTAQPSSKVGAGASELLNAGSGVPQERIRLRYRRPPAAGVALIFASREVMDGISDAYRPPVRHQQRQVPDSS